MIKKIFLYSLLAIMVSFFLFGGPVSSKDKLNAGSYYIPVMVESETEGAFIEIARTAAERVNIALNIMIYPAKRTQENFDAGKFEMMFPALDVNFPDLEKIIRSEAAIDRKIDYAFVRKGRPIIKTVAELKGKKVGLIRGFPYINAIAHSKDFTIDWTDTEAHNIEKLANGRIDVALGAWRAGEKVIINLGLQDKVVYDKNFPISEQKVYFAFQNNEKCRSLEKQFSKAVLAMQKDGTFQKIMEKHLKAAAIKD